MHEKQSNAEPRKPEDLLPEMRNAARAVMIRNQRRLLRKAGGGKPERCALPGGGQDTGESLDQALVRACRKAIGPTLRIANNRIVEDFFKKRHTSATGTRHRTFHENPT